MRTQEPSVVEAFIRAHAVLLEDLRALEQEVGPGAGGSVVELCPRLEATRTHLARHFRFEEENGYMDKVRQREPRLERAVAQLAGEHRELADALDALIIAAGAGTGPDGSLRERVRHWLEQVRQHENRENDLVQDAYGLDLGAED